MCTDGAAESVFGPVAELYEQARPEYPRQVAVDALEWSGITADGSILEIGCGTGKATRLFATFGHDLTALDPSPGMLEVARRVCRDFRNVQFLESKLEDWGSTTAQFDLVFSAMAFHWVDPETGVPKIGEVLKPGGTLAVIWHRTLHEDTPLRRAINSEYERCAPDLNSPAPGKHGMSAVEVIESSGLFGPVERKSYPWEAEYDAESWTKYLMTTSDHRSLPADRRDQLLSVIHKAIEADGGTYRSSIETQLLLCRRN